MSMKNKCFLFLIFIFITSFATDFHHSHPATTPTIDLTFENKNSHNPLPHGIRASKERAHHQSYNGYYAHLSAADFQRMFAGEINETIILSNYELYAYPNFCAYARTLSSYNEFIPSLDKKIKTDKQFSKKTACVPGFAYSFGLRHEKSGFHDFINDEAHRIVQARQQKKSATKQGNLHIRKQDLDHLEQEWSTRSKFARENDRLTHRLNALQVTCNHKNKSSHASFATELDYQLHQELDESRHTMNQLERRFPHVHYVQVLGPLVYGCVTQAEHARNAIMAFELSDFCHMVTQVLTHGMHVLYDASYAMGKGVAKGVSAITSVEHWKDMVTGCVHLGLLFADAVGQENALDYSVALARSSQDPDAVLNVVQQHCLHTQAQKDAINHCVKETCKKIKSMSWQDLLENGTEIGTTMILDTLALNAVGGFACTTSGSCIKQLTKATESGAIFTEQYAVEVAGFGKLIAEEGAEVSVKAADVIKKDLILCADGQRPLQQIRRKICPAKWAEEIAHRIRNVGDDILDIMEKTGGHTLERHVGKTYDYLQNRAMKLKVESVTTFIDKRTAINAIKESLKNNAEKIAEWLEKGLKDQIVIEYLHSYPIGEGIYKGKHNPYYNLRGSRMIMNKDINQELGFTILTAFPIIS
jgi:hypothetical protein